MNKLEVFFLVLIILVLEGASVGSAIIAYKMSSVGETIAILLVCANYLYWMTSNTKTHPNDVDFHYCRVLISGMRHSLVFVVINVFIIIYKMI